MTAKEAVRLERNYLSIRKTMNELMFKINSIYADIESKRIYKYIVRLNESGIESIEVVSGNGK